MAYSSPATWVAGNVLTAAQLNAQLRDNLLAAFPLGVDAWTGYTPTLTQSAAVTKTVTRAVYQRVGRLVVVTFSLSVTGAGTVSNNIQVGLPVAAAASAMPGGSMWIYDASANTNYVGVAVMLSTTTIGAIISGGTGYAGNVGGVMAAALASGDAILGHFTYEAAA